MKWVGFGYRKIHEEQVSFQPTRAKHEKSFILEAEQPVFLSSGRGVFLGPTCRWGVARCSRWLRTVPRRVASKHLGGIKKGVETQPFWVLKVYPIWLWVENGGYIFGEDSIEWKFDLSMNFLLNICPPQKFIQVGRLRMSQTKRTEEIKTSLRRDFFVRRKPAVCFCKIDWGIDHLFERSSKGVLCNHGTHDSFR